MITYFHRHKACGFSIFKVFSTIEAEIKKQEEVEDVFVPSWRSMPWDVVRNCLYTFRHRNKTGINHVTGHIHDVLLALTGCKTVLTVHDLVFLDHVRNPLKRFYKWLFWLYLPVRLADRVTCISHETRRRLLLHVHTDKVCVIHNPIDPAFHYIPKEFNVEKPVILHIGTGWNKNLMRTVMALQGIPCHLRIVGAPESDVLQALEMYAVEYSVCTGLTDEEIRQEYARCDIVNFPSVYEGFGMPVIEGQQTGRVVVTSRIEPLVEVSGGAAEFVNPLKVESIRRAYMHVISDNAYRDRLVAEGLENVRRFDVGEIASQYLSLYQKLKRES